MCGRYNIIDDADVRHLMDVLGVDLYPQTRLNVAPGSLGSIVYDAGMGRTLDSALWSLLIEPHPGTTGFRPSPRYSTFNARADRLGSSPLWKERFANQRAIVPASGFHEWTGPVGHKQCYNIRASEGAIAFAGLYEIWEFDGQRVASFTIITLPAHPRFAHIHPQSVPLMLRPEDFDTWLDPQLTHTDPFQHLLQPQIRVTLEVAPVRSPDDLKPLTAATTIAADRSAVPG
ncbi:SOS response-associated peptidase [Marinobacter mobilis]|uniref:Abasic site processing protein n=1 Tax=Marinobacter mobilis TaxID=488533 RepID=A0A1H2YAY6_9GAMM|nr:SOS response-associated peptidase [Marinobacter mobilis]SDX01719.1 Putative SOS response-associated peptidase YedK [Marinobacter mobilis]SDX49225.1 Putative SOS response-associated peptidase YedK [Marinobacter mobilis]